MAKWLITERDGDWTITSGGRFRACKPNEKACYKWLKSHVKPGDKSYIREEDGYLKDITTLLS